MNTNSVSKLQVKWWGALLTVFFTTLVFFISDAIGVSDNIHPVIRPIILITILVVILSGIKIIYDRPTSGKKP